MAHNARQPGNRKEGKNAYLQEKPSDMAVTSGVGAVAYRRRMKYQGHELKGDEQTARAVKEDSLWPHKQNNGERRRLAAS
jgi:hypothetical protein